MAVSEDKILLVCSRCKFGARVRNSDGWRMTDDTNGVCPACLADDGRPEAEASDNRKPPSTDL